MSLRLLEEEISTGDKFGWRVVFKSRIINVWGFYIGAL
jgi:hypothetical protein